MPALSRNAAGMILLGGLVVATLDILFAMSFWALHGVPPIRILQAIAAGVMGPEAAIAGGMTSASLGAALHYFIATMMVLAYALASLGIDGLLRRPIVHGLLYGLLLYALMQYVVVPLSAADAPAHFNLPWVLSSILVHMTLVSVPCALFARRALHTRPTSLPAVA